MRFVPLVSLLLLFAATPALAAKVQDGTPAQAGGFQGPAATANTAISVTTVKQAKSAADDTRVILMGHIVYRQADDHEHYLFRDGTGEIVVDIDDTLFLGRTVTPSTTIRIYGKVDRDTGKPCKIDVKRFEIQ